MEASGLHLLFAEGKRPTRAGIREFAQSHRTVTLSHDPAADHFLHLVTADGKITGDPGRAQSDLDRTNWVELLHEGLTFDLLGLAPGQPISHCQCNYRFDIDDAFALSGVEAIKLVYGHHLTGGAQSLPLAMGLVGLARDLVHHFDDLLAVAWPPGESLIGQRFFESVATAWLDGGAFPALGLTAFKETVDGALQSVGLSYWIGQELRIEPPLSNDKVAATRLGIRLINQLVSMGRVEKSEHITAPDGARLIMRPSENCKFLRVWLG